MRKPKKICMKNYVKANYSENIIRIQASSNYSVIWYVCGKKEVVSKHLEVVQNELHDRHFIRVHRSHLVNINYISMILTPANKTGLVELQNGEQIAISRRKHKVIKMAMKQTFPKVVKEAC